MTAVTHGLAAVGLPGTTFKPEWIELFRGKEVYLATDADKEGDEAAKRIAAAFFDAGLPPPLRLCLPDGQDLNEYLSAQRDPHPAKNAPEVESNKDPEREASHAKGSTSGPRHGLDPIPPCPDCGRLEDMQVRHGILRDVVFCGKCNVGFFV